MAETNIEWTAYRGRDGVMRKGYTFNPWIGCQNVGPGCDNCYAETQDKFRSWTPEGWGPGKPRRRTSAAYWKQPIKWNAIAEREGTRPKVFCASLADVFDNAVDPQWRADLFDLIRATPHLDWLLLTKRPGNIAKMLPADWGKGWPNVWLGCTIVNQDEADRDIPKLLDVPAAVRFLSMEPLLAPVDLTSLPDPSSLEHSYMDALRGRYWMPPEHVDWPTQARAVNGRLNVNLCGWINWVIIGGESGPHARPMHPDWAISLRDQCEAAGVPFLFKQWGEYEADEIGPEDARSIAHPPGHVIFRKVGKSRAGRKLNGRTHDDMPGVK